MFHRSAIAASMLAASMFGPGLAPAFVSSASAQTVLIGGEPGPNRGARAESMQWYADEVARLTDGAVTIDMRWGGALYGDSAAVNALRDGVADLGTIIGVYFPQEMAALGVSDLPLDNPDSWVGMRATDDVMRSERVAQDLARRNLVYLGTFTASTVQMGCRGREVRSIEDIAGVRMRGVGTYGQVFRDLGASLVNMSVYEAYQALETGLLDCTQVYSYLVQAMSFDEVLSSYTLLDWGQIGSVTLFMNKDTFDFLQPDEQEAMLETGRGLADAMGSRVFAANEEGIEILREQGTPVIEFDAAAREQLIAASASYIEQWKERADREGLDGEALLAEFQERVAHWTAVRDTEGYPWERAAD